MGSVWQAEDKRLDRMVAVKILASIWAESKDARARFEREAMAVASLHSPHIAQVFDYGIQERRPFIVMEMLIGEDLHHRLKRRKRLAFEEVGSIVVQTCRALHVAHKAQIVHRDLKPGNLMIDTATGDELVKVLDFGVAKAQADSDTEATKAGTLLGTPQYMAPEQARALPDVDHRADLWSLGVIAYRALTGRPPFRAKSVADMIVQICTADLPPASSLCEGLPPMIDVFFERALAREPDRRFETARAFASSFYRLMDTSAPSMSLSVGDTGSFPQMVADLTSDSYPLPDLRDSGPESVSHPVLQTQPAVVAESQGAAGPASEQQPLSDTLTSAEEGNESNVNGMPASASFGTQAAMVEDIQPAKPRGRLIGMGAAIAALVAGGVAFLALRGGDERQPESTAPPTEVAQATAAPTAPAAAPAASTAEPAEVATAAPTASATAEPATSAAPSATVEPRAPPPQPVWTYRPPRPKPKPKPTNPDDLLGNRH